MTTFDRYLLFRYLQIFLILFLSLYGLFVVFDGFTNVDAYQRPEDGTLDILSRMARYYGYQISSFYGQTGPLLSVISVMVVLGLLYKKSEIQPVLAAGVPLYRMIYPFLLGTVVVNVSLALNQEFILPEIAPYLLSRDPDHEEGKSIEPVLDRQSHIRIDGEELQLKKHRIVEPQFTLPPKLTEHLTNLTAESAVFREKTLSQPAGWVLHQADIPFESLTLTEEGRRFVQPGNGPRSFVILSDIGVDQLHERDSSFRYLSTRSILKRLDNPSYDEISIRSQAMHLHSRFTAPLANLIAVFVAVPLLIRREGRSIILNAAICTGVLTAIYGLHIAFEYLGSDETLSPAFAAWCPMILSGTYAAWSSNNALT